MSNYFTVLFTEKKWLLYSSYLGGAVGALLMHLNESFPVHGSLTFGMPMGMGLAVALGMIGGLVGGAFGAFLASRKAREDIVMGVGQSLGVGLMNGFLSGTAMGVIMGLVHTWWPHSAVAANLVLLGVFGIIAIIGAMRKP